VVNFGKLTTFFIFFESINSPTMRLYKTNPHLLIEYQQQFYRYTQMSWDHCINRTGLREKLLQELGDLKPLENFTAADLTALQAPVGQQEIWAAGVTYYRSRVARMEESAASGGADFYDLVYDAERPEIFYKGNALRTAAPEEAIYIRKDSNWNVPEPELTLWISSAGTIEGYTIGNDVSSRSIEGENPLYLPQAKVYDRSAALGPCIYLPENGLPPSTTIQLQIERSGQTVFDKSITIDQMKRGHQELVDYLYRECSFPHGCFLMTGTGIVPDNDFTLQTGDVVSIQIAGIGLLKNTVAQREVG
ncbi:MAG: fumarylacetoacetate hydrolase family protein, partial [Bacteroidota bacterium]